MMNKIITTALLLAAGTALANAANIVCSFDSFSEPTTSATEDKTGNFSIATGNDGAVGVTFNVDGSVSFPGSTTTATSYIWVNKKNDSSVNLSTANGVTVTMTISNLSIVGSSPDVIFALTEPGIGAGVKTTGASGTLEGINGANSYTTGGVSSSVDLSGKFVLTLVTSNSGTKMYVDGKNVYTSNDLKSSNKSITKVLLGGPSTGKNGAAFTLHNLYVHDAGLDDDAVASFVASVPEPSAFGLLAGLGALALVASRRRRSRK